MSENSNTPPTAEVPSHVMSRRRFLKTMGAGVGVGVLAGFGLKGDAVSADSVQATEKATALLEIIKPPSEAELQQAKKKLLKECAEPFTSEKKTYHKEYKNNQFEFTVVQSKTDTDTASSAIMVRKKKEGRVPESVSEVVIYNHSIEGLNFDMDHYYEDFSEVWDNDGAMIFPVMPGYKPGAGKFEKDDDFFAVVDEKNERVDLTDTEGWFSEYSPARMLRSVSALFENEEALAGKQTELIGVSLGGSNIGMMSTWEAFSKNHHLPSISKIGAYAPISTMLDKDVLYKSLQEGEISKEFGMHQVFRSFVQGTAYEFNQYLQKRYYVQTMALSDDGWKVIVTDNGDPIRNIEKKELYAHQGSREEVLQMVEPLRDRYQ